ncbi:MAG: S9 family peptidase, partial [Salinimicrobium sediminis]|nr:S9 family peptidase [Salinimicrobium sediminis]
MKKPIITVLAAAALVSCGSSQQQPQPQEQPVQTTQTPSIILEYPQTRKGNTVDTYFGNNVEDPYRWLEDDRSAETEAWVKAQNEVTFDYLEQIPFREELKNRLTELWNYEKISAPWKEGDWIYFSKNDGLQNQNVIYRKKSEDAPAEVFLDPNKFSEDGTTSLSGAAFSEDGKTLAYSISEGGSDWRKIIIMDAESREILEDTLIDVKFSGVSWKANEGFYYSSYDKPEGSELSAKTDQHKLYYHKLGTPQSEDKLIFGGSPEQKHRYVGGSVSEDNRYLFISARTSTSGGKLFMMDLSKDNPTIDTIVGNESTESYVLDNRGSKLYIVTNLDAPNRRIVTVDAANPTPENWKDLIPETKNVLSPATGGEYIFAEYMEDAVSKVKQYDYEGKLIREVELPGIGNVGGLGGEKEEKELYYVFTNYVTPGSIYKYNVESGVSELYNTPKVDFNPDDFTSEQVFYTSKDGTKVP